MIIKVWFGNMAQCRLHTLIHCFVLFVQAQLWQLAQRTTALPLGRGAFTLATIYTLLTEVLMQLCFFIYFLQLIFYFMISILEIRNYLFWWSLLQLYVGFYRPKACFSWSVARPTQCYCRFIQLSCFSLLLFHCFSHAFILWVIFCMLVMFHFSWATVLSVITILNRKIIAKCYCIWNIILALCMFSRFIAYYVLTVGSLV